MDLFAAIEQRRSCRSFSADPVEEEVLNRILTAAVWAPSPLNLQPWEFIVVTAPDKKEAICEAAQRCRQWAVEKSGWKWLAAYDLEFLRQAPVIIAVVGDPKKSGVDIYREEGPAAFQHACAAAIQNLMLAAHALGLGSLWFTMFEKQELRNVLEVSEEKDPLALVCLGKPAGQISPVPRKDMPAKVRFFR